MPRHRRNEQQIERQYEAQRWTFTINFEGRTFESVIEEDLLPAIAAPVGYRIYQCEAGESGTVHFQGYLELERPLNRRGILALPGMQRAALFISKGTLEQNQRYCTKEEGRLAGPFEEGDPCVEPGTRNDLLRLKDAIDGGADDGELWNVHFPSAVRYFKGLQLYRAQRVLPRERQPRVVVYWGDAGSGKSKRAFGLVRRRGWTCYAKSNGPWWDGYYGQHAVVWDEFDSSAVPARQLLRIIDRYECRVEVKGSSIQFNSPVIFITSNEHPRDWYPHLNERFQRALMRRIEKIVHFSVSEVAERDQQPHECEVADDSEGGDDSDCPPTLPVTPDDNCPNVDACDTCMKDKEEATDSMTSDASPASERVTLYPMTRYVRLAPRLAFEERSANVIDLTID